MRRICFQKLRLGLGGTIMNSNYNKPLVEIYMPTYNKGKFIKVTIKSILNQTFSNFHLIIVDNASTDETEQIVKSFHDPRVSYIRNPENIGAVWNINLCINMSRGDFVAIYHSDDIYDRTILEKEINFLQQNEEAKVVFTDRFIIDKDNKITSYKPSKFIYEHSIVGYEELLKENLINQTPLVCPTFMCRRSIFDEFNGYDTTYKYAGDTEYFLRIAKKYKIGLINEQLIKYRMYKGQESSKVLYWTNMQEEFVLLGNEIKYYEKNLNKGLDRFTLESYNSRLAAEYLRIAISYILINDKYSDKVNSLIFENLNKSFAIKKFSIISQKGIRQRLVKYRIYSLVKLLYRVTKGYRKNLNYKPMERG